MAFPAIKLKIFDQHCIHLMSIILSFSNAKFIGANQVVVLNFMCCFVYIEFHGLVGKDLFLNVKPV